MERGAVAGDTCPFDRHLAVVWIVRDEPLHEPAASVLAELHAEEGQLAVSPRTAWAFGYVLVARDRRLLDYGSEGHIQIMRC